MAEAPLYNNQKKKVRITRSMLEAKGSRYPIRNISRVRLDRKGETAVISGDYIFAIFLSILIAFATRQPSVALIMLLAFFFMAVDPSSQPKPIFDLTIIFSTNDDPVTLSPSDGEDLRAIQRALEDAIDKTYHVRDVKTI